MLGRHLFNHFPLSERRPRVLYGLLLIGSSRPSGFRTARAGSALGGADRTASAASSDGQHSQADLSEAGGSDCPSASRRQVDYSTPDIRAAIVDADDDGAVCLGVRDLDHRAERQSAMRRSECESMGKFAVGGLLATVYRCNS